MAIMIPQQCFNTCPIAQVLYKNLSIHLNHSYRVVEYLAHNTALPGALFWVQRQRQSLFIYLANSSDNDICLVSPGKHRKQPLFENRQVLELLKFQKKLLPCALHSHRNLLLPFLIINPYVKNTDTQLADKSSGLYFLGKELIKSKSLGVIVNRLLGIASSEMSCKYMRQRFSPEVLIDAVNANNDDNGYQLDESQEIALKTNLVSDQKGSFLQNQENSSSCVVGGASCGKTETLMQRVKLIRQLTPYAKLIVISNSNSTQAALKKRFQEQNISAEILAFNDYCKTHLKPSEYLPDKSELDDLIEKQLCKQLQENGISKSVFLRELDFICGREIYYESDYFSSQNISRPYPLGLNQFDSIWRAVLTLKNILSLKKWLLPAKIPQRLLDQLREKKPTVYYEHILVDDMHLLAPIALQIFREMLNPASGQLWFTQSSQVDANSNLHLQGDTIHLQNTYGINPAILNAAKAFRQKRLARDNNQDVLTTVRDSPEETVPRLLHFYAKTDAKNRLLNEIKNLIHAGCDPQEILIISSQKTLKQLQSLISETLKISVDVLNDGYYYGNKPHENQQKARHASALCDFQQAFGLNAPYVFIFEIEKIFNEENKLEAGTKYQQTCLNENTHLISQLMTRARKELTLFIVAKDIPRAFINPYIKIPTDQLDANPEKEIPAVSYLRR